MNNYIGPNPNGFRCSVGAPDGSTAGTLFPVAGSSKTDGNANCSIGGVQRLQTDSTPGTKLLVDSSNYSAVFNNALFTADVAARAGSGIVGASASVNFNAGFTNNQTVHDALAFAAFGDTITIGGASGTGFVVLGFDIDGTLSGWTDAAMEAIYRTPNRGTFSTRLVGGNAGTSRPGDGMSDPATGNNWAPGFTVTASGPVVTVTGRQTFYTAPIPIQFGQAFDFEFGLITVASEFRGLSDAAFYSTARLSAVDVFTSNSLRLADPTISTASGASWTTRGLQDPVPPPPPNAVPVPATAALLLAGLASIAALRRNRARPARH